ncbi:hypothetical protein [Mycobacterium sp. GA-2829]|uniref:hypothetical protein n=1 Tax=Mycobacterium sp. GA-2829 TaxID=1772283 RepID=UPI00073FFB4E|nr:hypothetical protein [Mycobacterium sp. GA-2829]KUI39086.1 hypothetical protein AU194_17265 [Mycobacterium sp. GA-2829]
MARYMLIMRVGPGAEEAMAEQDIDFDQIIESMGRFKEIQWKAELAEKIAAQARAEADRVVHR